MTTWNDIKPFAVGELYSVEGTGATAILTAEPLEDSDLDSATGGDSVARWHFENAWPVKASATKGGTDVAMEELTLAAEGLELG